MPSSYSHLPSYAKETSVDGRSLLPLNSHMQRKGSLKPSKSVRVKTTLKAIISPVKTRKEKKAVKNELREREEAERVANINDFLRCGRIYYEKQLQERMNYDPFSDTMRMEKC